MIMYQYNQNPYGDYQLFQGIGQWFLLFSVSQKFYYYTFISRLYNYNTKSFIDRMFYFKQTRHHNKVSKIREEMVS